MSETLINENQIAEEEWVKPEDWVDIRDGALPNSIYFLVGHSADFTKYPEFSFQPTLNTSGTYDVYVDGVKLATTNSNTETVLNWQTLNLDSGFNVTYPESLRTHVVRVTPSSSSNTIYKFLTTTPSTGDKGVLWVHFTNSNYMNLADCFNLCKVLEAVTCSSGYIKGYFNTCFSNCQNIIYIAPLDGNNQSLGLGPMRSAFTNCYKLKKIVIKNMTGQLYSTFSNCYELEYIDNENCSCVLSFNAYSKNYKLKNILPINYANVDTTYILRSIFNCPSLENFIIDASFATSMQCIELEGGVNYPIYGLKDIVLNKNVTFTGTNTPIIKLIRTGLDRSALVRFFNSLPYNVGYEIVGSPTIENGIVSGFSASDYLVVQKKWDTTKPWELNVAFTLSSINNPNGIIGSKDGIDYQGLAITTNTSNQLRLWLSSNGTGWDITSGTPITSYPLSDSIKYYLKLVFSGNAYILSISTDNSTFDTLYTVNSSTAIALNSTGFALGYNKYTSSSIQYLYGSLDLENTNIKVEDVFWFRGKQATDKVCYITGTLGAEDLTATDIQIATDKGWTVTR